MLALYVVTNTSSYRQYFVKTEKKTELSSYVSRLSGSPHPVLSNKKDFDPLSSPLKVRSKFRRTNKVQSAHGCSRSARALSAHASAKRTSTISPRTGVPAVHIRHASGNGHVWAAPCHGNAPTAPTCAPQCHGNAPTAPTFSEYLAPQ